MGQVYNAIILQDYSYAQYASWIKEGSKTIETRTRNLSALGDLVICCAKSAESSNAGKALCIVNVYKIRPMVHADALGARIDWSPDLKSYLLKDWRKFSRDFKFAPMKVKGDWRGIFKIEIPENVEIIAQPEIVPHHLYL